MNLLKFHHLLVIALLAGCAPAQSSPTDPAEIVEIESPEGINLNGTWTGILAENIGDLRIFSVTMQITSEDETGAVTGSIIYHLEQDPAYEEIHQFEGVIEGNTLKISTDLGQYQTYTISAYDLAGQVAFECFECAPWGGIELTRADGQQPVAENNDAATEVVPEDVTPFAVESTTMPFKPFLTLDGHGLAVRTLDWSPDGTKIATSGEDNNVVVWDAQTGQVLKSRIDASKISPAGDWPTVVSWQPDGKKILLGHPDGSIQIWDWIVDQVTNLTASTAPNPVSCLEMKPDGTEVAVCSQSFYDVGRSFILDINSGQKAYDLPSDSSNIKWSPDGQTFADSSPFGLDLRASSSALLWSALKDFGSNYTLDWSTDGNRIVVSTAQAGKNIILNNATGAELVVLESYFSFGGTGYAPSDLQWQPGTNSIAALSDDHALVLWDADTGEITGSYPTELTYTFLRWSPDGQYLAFFGGFSNSDGALVPIPVWKYNSSN